MKKDTQNILKHGFTLMELMVVIVVISILVGLLIPAILKAKEGAREKKARTEVYELQKAWGAYVQYHQERNSNYTVPSYDVMDAAATGDLGGGNADGIVFMEFTPDELKDGFKDPWKELYYLEFIDPDDVTTEWSFQTRVQCKNAARGKY
jgi:prepilin-type N-terminal cleavage/methylation domain-containing protein